MDWNRSSEGIYMQPQVTWRLFDIKDHYGSVLHLDMLFPPDSVLCLEGTCIEDDIQEFVSRHAPSRVFNVQDNCLGAAVLTIVPFHISKCVNKQLHMLMTPDNLRCLRELMGHHAPPEVADNIHVYRNGIVLMEAHDWPGHDVYVAGEVSEQQIRSFCKVIGGSFEQSMDLVIDGQ